MPPGEGEDSLGSTQHFQGIDDQFYKRIFGFNILEGEKNYA